MATVTQALGQPSGSPFWVAARDSLPPDVNNVFAALSSAMTNLPLSGAGGSNMGPPASLVPSDVRGPPPGMTPPSGVTGPPPGFAIPTGVTGPPAGFSIPPGMTGPPAGFSIPSGVTGPPAGFSIPSGVNGPPAGMTNFPSGPPRGGPGGGMHAPASSPVVTGQQSQAMIGVTCMLLVLCLAAVGGRLVARRISRVRLEADDWICVAALALFIALCIEQFILARYGLLLLSQLPPSLTILHALGKTEFASQITYSSVTCVVKISLLMLYRRIFSLRAKWFRIAWWTNVGLVGALFIVFITSNFTQCKSISTIWDSPGTCIPNQTKTAASGFLNAAIDSAILILPLRMVWSLQMDQKQKLAICGVFGLGLIGVAISLARAIALASPEFFKGGGLSFIIWSTTEPAVGLICACIPVLRPLYTTGLAKLGSSKGWSWYASKKSRSYGNSTGSSSRPKENSNLMGSTLLSALSSKGKNPNINSKEMGSDVAGPYEEMKSSPISPFDKPLPPAYTTRQEEEDTGYHTWSWNLLSKPRNEFTAPKLTRSPASRDRETQIPARAFSRAGESPLSAGGKDSKCVVSSPHPKTHPPTLHHNDKQSRPSGFWNTPPGTTQTSPSVARSPFPIPSADANNWTSPSPMRAPQPDLLQKTLPASPINYSTSSPRPEGTARMEASDRTRPPKLKIRTQNNGPFVPAPPPGSPIPQSQNNEHHQIQVEAVGGSPLMGSNGGSTIRPSAGAEITRKEVEAAILRGHAM